MTSEQAVSVIRRYKRDAYRYSTDGYLGSANDPEYRRCVYGSSLCDIFIEAIRGKHADMNPLDVVWYTYCMLEEVIGESDDDHFETHNFAAIMQRECFEIFCELLGKEARDAKN